MIACGMAMADPSSITIKLDRIELTRPEGVSMVYERIRRAASKVCLHVLLDYGSSASTAYSDCVDRATEAAVRTIDRKMRAKPQARSSRPEDPVSPGS